MMKTLKTVLLSLALLAPSGVSVEAQVSVVSTPESKLWITGSSTVNSFTCMNEDATGMAVLPGDEAMIVRTAAREEGPRVEVIVPVQGFDCGRERMNRDFYQALRADEHPAIRFTLIDAVMGDKPAKGSDWRAITATGTLSIAGTARVIDIEMKGRIRPDGTIHVTGSKPLLMSAFGITPPTAMLGLIKARDAIEVHFDMHAAVKAGVSRQ